MIDYVFEVMKIFGGSFINADRELILVPKTNLYIPLKDVHTANDLRFKLLECCSRDSCKAQPFASGRANTIYRKATLNKLNKSLGTQFTSDEMELIYQELGNGVNHELTKQFVYSGYDMKVLQGEEE